MRPVGKAHETKDASLKVLVHGRDGKQAPMQYPALFLAIGTARFNVLG